MKERPILFSAPMVRAILEGRKTQTRRVVKFQDGLDALAMHQYGRCPYGGPGDRLWVRETFKHFGNELHYDRTKTPHILFRDNTYHNGLRWPNEEIPCRDDWTRWRPSIHMPRWASRLTLEVVSVQVERLNEISESDAKAEGVTVYDGGLCYRDGLCALWDSINAKRHPWASNPWVWVVEFRKLEAPR